MYLQVPPVTLILGGCALNGGTLQYEQIDAFVWYIVTVQLRCVLMAHFSQTIVEGVWTYSNVAVHH